MLAAKLLAVATFAKCMCRHTYIKKRIIHLRNTSIPRVYYPFLNICSAYAWLIVRAKNPQDFSWGFKRREPDLNRRWRCCRPGPYHLAITPYIWMTPTGIEPVLPPWKGDVLTAWPWSQNSPSRARTYNNSVNSRVLYHWAIEEYSCYRCKCTTDEINALGACSHKHLFYLLYKRHRRDQEATPRDTYHIIMICTTPQVYSLKTEHKI